MATYILNKLGSELTGAPVGASLTKRTGLDVPRGYMGEFVFSIDCEFSEDRPYDPSKLTHHVFLTNKHFDELKEYIFTFGSNHIGDISGPLGSSYMVVNATSFNEAREIVWEHTGACFAFQYESRDKAGIDKFCLVEVPLQKVTRG